jgi:hypothetical protein
VSEYGPNHGGLSAQEWDFVATDLSRAYDGSEEEIATWESAGVGYGLFRNTVFGNGRKLINMVVYRVDDFTKAFSVYQLTPHDETVDVFNGTVNDLSKLVLNGTRELRGSVSPTAEDFRNLRDFFDIVRHEKSAFDGVVRGF